MLATEADPQNTVSARLSSTAGKNEVRQNMRPETLTTQCLFNGALCIDILENVTLTLVVEHCQDR